MGKYTGDRNTQKKSNALSHGDLVFENNNDQKIERNRDIKAWENEMANHMVIFQDPNMAYNGKFLDSQDEKQANGIFNSGKKEFKIEYITRKSKRKTTFIKRQKGLMKKSRELAILTGAGVLCIVTNEKNEVAMYVSEQMRSIGEECKKLLSQRIFEINSKIG